MLWRDASHHIEEISDYELGARGILPVDIEDVFAVEEVQNLPLGQVDSYYRVKEPSIHRRVESSGRFVDYVPIPISPS